MAKYAARGSLVKATISAVLTTIGQVRSARIGDSTSDTIQVDALDDSGVGHDVINAGTVTQENITGELFFDPDEATHNFITDTIADPSDFPVACSVVFPDATPASATFSAVGFGFGATINVGEALMGNFTIICDGVVTWP